MTKAKKLLNILNEIKMVCIECGHKFNKNIKKGTYEVKCPKCGGYDTEPA